jgi:hypothetical protein
LVRIVDGEDLEDPSKRSPSSEVAVRDEVARNDDTRPEHAAEPITDES